MRTITPIKYEWVTELLPKLHDVDVFSLSTSGVIEGGVALATSAATQSSTAATASSDAPEKRRTTDDAVSAARERYLERKRQRLSGQ